jgi:O-antigen/teichoic acid export membrane protein
LIASLRDLVGLRADWRERLLGGRTRRNLSWATLGSLSARGGQALGMVAAARVLGVDDFGRLGLLYVSAYMVYTLIGAGIGGILIRFVARDRAMDPAGAAAVIGAIRAWTIGGSLAAVLAVVLFRDHFGLIFPVLPSGLLIGLGLVYALLMINAEVESAVLMAFQHFRVRAVLEAAAGLTSLVAIPLGAWLLGLPGAFTGFVLSASVWCFGTAALSTVTLHRHGIRPPRLPKPDRIRAVAAEIIPYTLAGLIVMGATALTQFMIAHRPSGLAELGIFTAARQWLVLATFPGIMLSRVAMPAQAELAQNPPAARAYTSRQARHALLMALPPALLIALASPLIMLLYGPAFAPGWPALTVLMLSTLPYAASGLLQNRLVTSGATHLVLGVNVGWATVAITTTWIGIEHGALGLASAFLLAELTRHALLCLALRSRT